MPAIVPPPRQFLGTHLSKQASQVRALGAGSTQYVIDPTIKNPSATTPNCRAIIGNVASDNFGNGTLLPASGRSTWGIAVFDTATNAWTQL